jgi:choline dehydrogenase-like flavoprotein
VIIDARSVHRDEIIETEVCIVGAGLAGLTLAKEFIDQNFRVCLLESGGLKPDRETQALYQGENIGHPYYSLDSARARYFGGTSNRWHIAVGDDCSGVRMRPLDAIDFEKRDWVPFSGWPFDKSYLDPFYERAQEICKITPTTYDVADWADPSKTPPLNFGEDRVKTVIYKFGSRLPFVEDYSEIIRAANNITTCLYANVTEIETDETAHNVKRLRVECLEGNKFWVKANLVILATGAIEIPRLLLSSNQTHKTGLANQNDLVGRFFMEHPHSWTGFYIPSSPEIFRTTALYSDIHKVHSVPIIGKLSLSEEVIRKEKLLNYVGQIIPRIRLRSSLSHVFYPAVDSKSVRSYKMLRSAISQRKPPDDLLKHFRNILSGIDDFAVTAYRNIKRRAIRLVDKRKLPVFCVAIMSEQAPNPDSRVTLGDERDALGQRLVRLNWQLTPMDINSIIRSQQIMDEAFRKSGLGRLYIELSDETPPHKIEGGYHHMGTTRMHSDPKKGVVDQNCQVHDMSNLFIAGPSVFPTSGQANPALTTVALCVRLADHVKELMKCPPC